eukprot:gnl/MRDRNA2_/MRDRNA2_97040_c0_seq1.p1 gnl/MRDRNA2_/MRDRNA2_97040_c0~~gnl/MRDRNA2_/MRDRNA2_97040_c0_seq1.p1  ORF type:complete len:366 (+),score=55.98 gnl/MRDRNA2_/MRDRNA2_97040_c0_seq1:80-1177(+)
MMNQSMVSAKTNNTKAKPKSNMLSQALTKTRMCKFHLLGKCFKGTDCGFAHNGDELQPLPNLSRTRLCQVLLQTGRCNNKNCSYAHSNDELVLDSCRKTKFCRFWQVGKCNLGAECRFAHSVEELREPAGFTGELQQQDQKYNDSIAIPTIIDTPPMKPPGYLVAPKRLNPSGQEVFIRAPQVPIRTYESLRTQQDEGQEWNPPSKMELTRGTSDSTQDSDGFNSWADSSESEVETAPRDFAPDSYESRAPKFPSNHEEALEHFKMVPSMWHLPVLTGQVHQPSNIKSDTGDMMDYYTGAVEIMQQTPSVSFHDNEDDVICQGFFDITDYHVKNTFISFEDKPAYYPLRCVRSAAGRLTDTEHLS